MFLKNNFFLTHVKSSAYVYLQIWDNSLRQIFQSHIFSCCVYIQLTNYYFHNFVNVNPDGYKNLFLL
jgi:hypothetical protein